MIRCLACLVAVLLPVQGMAASPIADIVCAPRQAMELRLKGNFRASLQATGLRGPDQVVEIWADQDGDWAMVMAYASGQSCIVAMGDAWEFQTPPRADAADPS